MDLKRTRAALAGLSVLTLSACGSDGTRATPSPGSGADGGAIPGADSGRSCGRETEVPFAVPPDPSASVPACAIPGGTIGALADDPDPEADVGNGTKPGDDTGAPATLPDRVALRTYRETFNRRYEFALDDGRIWFKSHTETTGIEQPWARLALPGCLDGTIVGIAVDDDELVAIRADGAVYGMDNARKAPSLFNWSSRWGAPVWQGAGFRLPSNLVAWTWMVISPFEDGSWTDPAGNHPAVGLGKVSHVWALREGGQRFTLFDPWLPTDDSYEMCGPERGRFRAANLSASGSTIAAIDVHGEIYTRHYDFDLAGDDAAFFQYSYDDQRGIPSSVIQLPVFDWVHQTPVPGKITLNVSVHKVGRNMEHRFVRVEGEDDAGVTGYWEKDVGALGTDAWRFEKTGRPLSRALIDDAARGCPAELGEAEDLPYSRNLDHLAELDGRAQVGGDDDWAGELVDFNVYCSPAVLRIHVGKSDHFDLRLHTTDVIRQVLRARGLDDNPRGFSGAIEVPDALFSDLSHASEKTRQFVKLYLSDRRFTPVTLHGVAGQITFETPMTWAFSAE